MVKNLPLLILIWIFVVANLTDLVTAKFILAGESNPIFLFSKSYLLLVIAKLSLIVYTILMYRYNKFENHFWYFTTIIILCFAIFLFSLGAYGNIQGMIHPEIVEQAANLPTSEKVKAYAWMAGLLYILPAAISLISFQLYRISKNKVEFKRDN